MARPREFDETAALDAAIQQFWANGYEATSVRDLAGCMGITGASLYNAFGDKRSLYRQALNRYVDQSFGDRVRRFETHLPPREAIRAFFSEIIERSLADPQRKGCMLINSASEVAPHDPEFQPVIANILAEVEAFFRRCVDKGQKDGSIACLLSADDLARHMLAILVGIRVLVRARPERELLEGMVRPAMAMLDS
ncbi:TetR/AcrR family transcriptional regulator [Mesorhizobium sp. PL10]